MNSKFPISLSIAIILALYVVVEDAVKPPTENHINAPILKSVVVVAERRKRYKRVRTGMTAVWPCVFA